jgi:ferredoxin-type protein NapG
MSTGNPSRREFLAQAAQGAALAATGGLIWGYLLKNEARAAPFALRPPGALPEPEFAARCIKCGQCVRGCPYDTLKLVAAGGAIPIGTPYFQPRDVPCYMCPDIPCKAACPTGALDSALDNIARSRMGLAVIDIENCLSWIGLRCEVCYRVCPVKGRAISVERHPRRVSKHALFVPLVHSDACTGCGLCEKACPTEQAAIRVLEPSLVQGRIGEHYRLGWKVESPLTQDFQPAREAAPAAAGGGSAVDYLNEGLK